MNTVSMNAERGSTFVSFAKDLALGKADLPLITRGVPAGSTQGDTGAAWGASMVTLPGGAEFVGLVRSAQVLGQLPLARRVPFRTPVVVQLGGGLFLWRGEGTGKTVISVEHEKTRLDPRTAAGIIVLSRELLAATDGEAEIRRELIDGIVGFLDTALLDPSATEVANVSPASITSGATAIPSSGDPATDLEALIGALEAALETSSGVALVMSALTALGIALRVPGAFPAGPRGGLFGIFPTVLSAAASDNIIAIHQPSLLFAEGELRLDRATHAAIEMAANPATGAAELVSLWQTNAEALRVERELNFRVAVAGSVQLISGVGYAY